MGLPAPVLEEVATHFRVTLLGRRERPPLLDEVDELVVDALGQGRGLSTAEVADRAQLSSRATRTRLLSLVDRGLVVAVGSSSNDPRRRCLPAEGS